MNLNNKKKLAMRTFGVGKDRIYFVGSRLNEIKEAITKQDMRDLVKNGAIIVRPIKGKLKRAIKYKRRTPGNVRKRVIDRKRDYINLTRKLRKYVKEIGQHGKINKNETKMLRKKIRNKEFKNLAYLKLHIKEAKE